MLAGFVAGKVYVLQHVGYSRVDSSTVFAFRLADEGTAQSWWWHDDDPGDLCARRFRLAGQEDDQPAGR